MHYSLLRMPSSSFLLSLHYIFLLELYFVLNGSEVRGKLYGCSHSGLKERLLTLCHHASIIIKGQVIVSFT